MTFRIAAVPAVLLSALTLAVFWILRDFGPESALRKFHEASVMRDSRALEQVSDLQGGPQFTQALQAEVLRFAQNGGQYQLRRIQRRNNEAIAEVVYRFPKRGIDVPMLWVVNRRNGRWLVNPYQTDQLMRRALGG